MIFNKPGEHLSSAVEIASRLVRRIQNRPLPAPVLLNINVPDRPWQDIQGVEITRLGRRHHAEPVIKTQNPRGETVYWVGPVGSAQDAGPGTDFHANAAGKISITPLQIDLSAYAQLATLEAWWDESDS